MSISFNKYRKRNKKIEHNGQIFSIKEWAEKLGVKRELLWQRIYKYKLPLNEALSNKKYLQKQKGRKITWGNKISNSLSGIKRPQQSGEGHFRWISDRTKLKRYTGCEERRSPAYKDWRKKVCDRDEWKCKINNNDCAGKIEVHHILSFKKYPELKYEVNNGICLCKNHHPRKRIQETILINYFKKLIAV
jgi:hypothetical protein